VKGLLGALVFLNKCRFLLKCIFHCCLINILLLAKHITYIHTRFCLIHIKLCMYTKRIQFTFIHILFLFLVCYWALFNCTICIFFVCNEIKVFFLLDCHILYYILLVIHECFLWLVPKNKLKTKTRKFGEICFQCIDMVVKTFKTVMNVCICILCSN
jgi:hypothetical protein